MVEGTFVEGSMYKPKTNEVTTYLKYPTALEKGNGEAKKNFVRLREKTPCNLVGTLAPSL